MADHAPSMRRAVLRRLKGGEHPASLMDAAKAIPDPGHRAPVWAALAADGRLPAPKTARCLDSAARDVRAVDRPGRIAEVLADTLRDLPGNGPAVQEAAHALVEAAVQRVLEMPDGEWTAKAALAVAPHTTVTQAEALLRRSFTNQGFEVAPSRALLGAHPDLSKVVQEEAPPEAKARLLAGSDDAFADAVAAAWAIQDVQRRNEALRVMAWDEEDATRLRRLAKPAKSAADAAAAWTLVAGRLDRLGHDPSDAFEAAATALAGLKGKDAVKAHRKLAQAMQRAGRAAPPAPAQTSDPARPDVPVEAGARHVLALVDGYAGGLAAPHVRAVARAAPLCIAFDLDLALVGFPTDDLEALVGLVEAETQVGEGEDYTRRLFDGGRLRLLALGDGRPEAWPGTPVATTPHPDAAKQTGLNAVVPPVCLLVGLGKQGLPRPVLDAIDHHHELTGRGISMETATAMGILADRLGQLPR